MSINNIRVKGDLIYTGVREITYPSLFKPHAFKATDVKQFRVNIKLDREEADFLEGILDERIHERVESLKEKGKKIPHGVITGLREEKVDGRKTGNKLLSIAVDYDMFVLQKDDKGNLIKDGDDYVKVLDEEGEPLRKETGNKVLVLDGSMPPKHLPSDTNVGSGSKAEVIFSTVFTYPGGTKVNIKPRLQAVRVVEVVEYEGTKEKEYSEEDILSGIMDGVYSEEVSGEEGVTPLNKPTETNGDF